MNQLVLLFTAIAVLTGVIGLGGSGETSNLVWLILFSSGGAAVYFFWKNRGEGAGSSKGYGPSSNDADGTDAMAATPDGGVVGYEPTSNDANREDYSNR